MLKAKKTNQKKSLHVMTFCVCVCVRERERERRGGERETVNENWCEDTGRMYRVMSRNHKYMNPVGTT